MKVADSLVEVPGGRIFVRSWGSGAGEGAPIILLHDSLGSVEQWRDFPEALARATERCVVAYDRLGFGQSSPRTGLPSVDFIAEEGTSSFPALKRALGIGRCALFGHSVGGAMALTIAASQSQACEAVITAAAQAFVEPRTLAGIRTAQAQFADPAQFAKLVRWHGDKARWVLDAWAGVWLSPEFASWELGAGLGKVTCPVLAIHGDLDEYGSVEFPRRITSWVGGRAQLAILSGCGHMPHRERRDEVLRLSSSFLEQA
ncbi:MAG: alpha/beta fold hydrolase [Steroidobacteraceae bacterium]